MWAFGSNGNGELGRTANLTANPSPTRVLGLSAAIGISADGHHSLVLLANHTVVAFGPNLWGQLGTATNSGTATPTAPTPVAGLANATAMAGGNEHSLFVRADGSVVTFGHNLRGQLGFTADAIAHPAITQVIASGIGQPPSFAPVVPARLLDTRPTGSTIDGIDDGGNVRDADTITAVQVVGRGGVPIDATTVALNVTVTGAQGTGYITVYPCGNPQPNASNLNYQAGSTIANAVIAKVGVGGSVCVYTSAATQLIVDVNAYYRDSTAFGSLVPARLLDTRPDSPTVDGLYENLGPLEANEVTQSCRQGRRSRQRDRHCPQCHGEPGTGTGIHHCRSVRQPATQRVERQLRGRFDDPERSRREDRGRGQRLFLRVGRNPAHRRRQRLLP